MTAILDYAQVYEPIEADGRAIAGELASWDISSLIMDVQARGLRVEGEMERRSGGAGPTDSGMLWIEGYPVTAPTGNATSSTSPYLLKAEDDGYGIYRDEVRVASARAEQRPRFYDLVTADGIPYEKIALLVRSPLPVCCERVRLAKNKERTNS